MLKKFIQTALLLVVLFTTVQSYAQVSQAPDGIQFQALATDANGHPAAGRVIYVKDAIIAKTATGTIVYAETFKVTASSAGIFTIVLGKGTYASGVSSIANIDWANGPFFLNLKVAVEPTVPNAGWNANNEYVDLGTSQFWSVPYALYAGNVKGADGKLNTSDTAAMLKPYFTAINLKANIESPTFTGTVKGITKAMVGLGNVDNTSDLDKPISNATKTSLDLKANAADVTTALDLKVDKVSGKALSTNDYTTAEKTKLAAITGTNTGDQDLSALAVASNVNAALALKANTADVTAALDTKVSSADATAALALKANTTDVNTALALKANTASLSTVATTGSYTDLINKPTIPSAYTLPVASASVLGGVKVGSNLSIDANGVLSATASNNASSITGTLPVANGGTGTTTVAGIKSVLGLNTTNVAIGDQSGQTSQAAGGVGVGAGAGANNQGGSAVAIGYVAGYNNQGASSIAIGPNAAQAGQSAQAVAIGFAAGQNGQGANAVAIGTFAGQSGQAANSIAINASGTSTPLNPANAGFYVDPIRNASSSNSLFYDASTKEITYGTASSSGVPYTGATGPVNLGAYNLTVNGLTLGKGAGSNNGVNTAFGASALAANTTGAYNTAIGFQVLTNNTTGNNNHALGFQALAANTSGNRNTAFGEASLPRNTSGSDNIGIGVTALFRNTTADNNIAIGTQALGNSLTGSNNVAIGSQALTGNSTSSNNTAVGYQSLQQTSGSDNTAIGRLSMMANTTGSFNTAVGSLADVNSNNLSNTTAIGYGARVLANNTIQLGADGTGFVTNGVNVYTTAITNVRTSGSLTAGAVTYPNTNGTAGQVLTANNNGNASWTTIASVADASTMTGTVAIAKGGTGATTATAALTNLGAAPLASPTFTGTVTTDIINTGALSATSINAPTYASAPKTLTYTGSTINWNPAQGLNAAVTLTQNSTLSFTTAPPVGSYGTVVLTQDATGNKTITLPSINGVANKVLGSASTSTVALSTAAYAKDILNFYFDGSSCYWNIGQGYGSAASSASTNLATSVSGTLAVANGGTGATSATAALTNLGAAPIASPTFTGTVSAPIYASTPQVLTDGSTITWNPALGLNASVTLGGNRTLSFSTTPVAGAYGTLVVSQDGTGNRTITLPSTANKVLGSTSTTTIALSTAANAKDILNFYYDGTNCFWNIGQGYGSASASSATNLATGVTGTLPVANGGTGTTNGSITGTSSITITAGGSDQNVSILPSGAGSVGIGTNSPNSLAILDVSSTTKGFLPPRMTYAQKIAIASPPQGLMIYCTNCGTNGEPEYYNGTAWVNMAGGTAASVPITLGSTYGGGKVFYILQSGDPGYVSGETHGLIAATSDVQGYRVFGCRGWPAGTSAVLGTGAANTTTLLGCNETNFAAKLARAVRDGGYSDWYLPSKDELNKLYLNKNLVGNFLDVNYWSSTEGRGWVGGTYYGDLSAEAFYQNFNDGTQSWDDKNAQKGIRAIRSF